jgi:hypothetical protein
MEKEEELVSARLFRDTLAGQIGLTHQLQMIVEALVKILQHQGLLTPELWRLSFPMKRH